MEKKDLTIKEKEKAIFLIKNFIESKLKEKLNLIEVRGPLIVEKEKGLNDNLTGNNLPVSFYVNDLNENVEVVQSLAKWKRWALKEYDFNWSEGLFVNMNAIRSHEVLDNLHSLYVDQWDWELIINKEQRKVSFLKETVNTIFNIFKECEEYINSIYPFLSKKLPQQIHFFDSQEIEDMYGSNNYEEAVKLLCKQHKAIFIIGIGKKLKSGNVFDQRSSEYDDWELNGDFFVYSPIIDQPIELSSMGIRVDKNSLIKQANIDPTKDYPNQYYEMIINNELPLTIGGGIGRSRSYMFLLEQEHLAQIQPSVWTKTIYNDLKNKKIKIF